MRRDCAQGLPVTTRRDRPLGIHDQVTLWGYFQQNPLFIHKCKPLTSQEE